MSHDVDEATLRAEISELMEAGEHQEALRLAMAAAEAGSDVGAMELATAMVQLGLYDEAVPALRLLLDADDLGEYEQALLRMSLAQALAGLDRVSEADAEADQAWQLAPFADVAALHVELLLDGRQPKRALAVAERAIAAFPEEGTLEVLRGRALQQLRRSKQARQAFARGLALGLEVVEEDPTDHWAWLAVYRAATLAGDEDARLQAATNVVCRPPLTPELAAALESTDWIEVAWLAGKAAVFQDIGQRA